MKSSNLKQGHFISELQFYRVIDKGNTSTRVVNERGFEFNVSNDIIDEGYVSADQFDEERSVTRTELIEIFSQAWGGVFTVHFRKQPKFADISAFLSNPESLTKVKKDIKAAFEGQPRTLVGYLIKTETGFGRSMVIDLEKERGNNLNSDGRISQVDHRSIEWLIWKGVKYVAR